MALSGSAVGDPSRKNLGGKIVLDPLSRPLDISGEDEDIVDQLVSTSGDVMTCFARDTCARDAACSSPVCRCGPDQRVRAEQGCRTRFKCPLDQRDFRTITVSQRYWAARYQ